MNEFGYVTQELQQLKNSAFSDSKNNANNVEVNEGFGTFEGLNASLRYMFMEKENFVFALLQWLVAVLGLFVVFYGMVGLNDEVKQIMDKEENQYIMVAYFSVWAIVVLLPIGYIIGLLSSCMSASFLLRFQGQKSTFLSALKLVLAKRKSLGIFSVIDFVYSFYHIAISRGKKKSIFSSLTKESLFQTWKVVSAGFVPAILYGRTIKEACDDCYKMSKESWHKLLKLRIVYGVLFWGVYILALISCGSLCCKSYNALVNYLGAYTIYICIAIPFVLFFLVAMVVVCPLYVISLSRCYAGYARRHAIIAKEVKVTECFSWLEVCFILLCGIIVFAGKNINDIAMMFLNWS